MEGIGAHAHGCVPVGLCFQEQLVGGAWQDTPGDRQGQSVACDSLGVLWALRTALSSVIALEVGRPLPARVRPHPAGLRESGPQSQRKKLSVQFTVWGLVSM